MYSMVLMMAMASGPATAAFGGHRNSCCGAQATYSSCHGGGSSCHGSRHGGGLLGHRNGCNGGSSCHGGGSSCHGGGGGLFHRNRGGCTGSTAAACCQPTCAPAANCCAPGTVAPAAPPATMPAPTPMGDKKGS